MWVKTSEPVSSESGGSRLKIAQAKAEERRAMAVAREQEMKALAQEMKAKVIEAEANIPTLPCRRHSVQVI